MSIMEHHLHRTRQKTAYLETSQTFAKVFSKLNVNPILLNNMFAELLARKSLPEFVMFPLFPLLEYACAFQSVFCDSLP